MSIWYKGLAGVFALIGATSVTAQVTYSVFPAVPQNSSPTAPAQPTDHGMPLVTLSVRDSTLAYAVDMVVHQAHLRLSYDVNSRLFARRVTANVDHVPVMDALAVVLKGSGLVAKMAPDGETVVVRGQARPATTGQTRLGGGTIDGRVSDSASGQRLGGVAVKVAGTTLAAVTSDSGHFTLTGVPSGEQVLAVKLFGYKPVERTVTVVDSQRTTVRIIMVPIPTVLSGVVTTATGQQRKIEVGNDVTTLNVDSIRRIAPITSVTDLLETRVPGLTVLHSSGTPGDPARLRLRGLGTIQGNDDPIVYVDGIRVYAYQSSYRTNNLADPGIQVGEVTSNATAAFSAPSPLDQIDPANIESVEILKGPSATAVYGSDAAAGVIVITTKHGRAGPTVWTLNLGQGVNWSPGRWPTNYFRFGSDTTGVSSAIGVCPWYILGCHVDSVVAFQALNDSRFSPFSHGSDRSADLTVSGGTQTFTYSVTGSGAGTVGLLKLPGFEQARYDSAYGTTLGPIPHALVRPDNYATWGVNGSMTALPSSALRVTLMSSLFNSTQQQGSLSFAIPQLAGTYLGRDIAVVGGTVEPVNAYSIQGFVERATAAQVTQTNALSLHWQALRWLPLDATGGLNTITSDDHTYIPFGISAVNPGAPNQTDTTGHYGLGRGVSHEQTVTVGTVIPLPLMTLALGGNSVTETTADVRISSNQLAPGVSTPTSFCGQVSIACNVSASQNSGGTSTYGWYVEPRFNFHSRFFVAPGFRLDGGNGGRSTTSSGLGALTAFPKMDFSWIAVDRQGSRPLWGLLTLLRPRVALGVAGTQPSPNQKLRLYNGTDFTAAPLAEGQRCEPIMSIDGTTEVSAVCLSTLGNTQLRPERTRELEGGVDATLWNGRLTVTYTQYTKQTQDAILDIPVAPSATGLSSMSTNIGVIRNTGTELTANATILESRALSWNVGVNLSNNNNLMVRLNKGQQIIQTSTGYAQTRVVPGYPLFGLWAQPIASFVDANHDGIIENNEIILKDSSVYVGQPNPKYQLNLSTGVTILNGRLSANATFAYENGLTQNNQGACNSFAFLSAANATGTPLSTQAAIVAAGNCVPSFLDVGSASTSIGMIQTVNTFRFNALSVNYEVPRAIASWFRVPRMSLALQGSNLGLYTNYRGKDPNVNAFSTVIGRDETLDLGQLPEPRTWWLKLTLSD